MKASYLFELAMDNGRVLGYCKYENIAERCESEIHEKAQKLINQPGQSVSIIVNYLHNIYGEKTINSILESAINHKCEIHFLNQLTKVPQPLTMVQLMGIKKFGGVSILLETGQTYQIGLEMGMPTSGTYQEIYLKDLIVDNETLGELKSKFGQGDKR